MYGYSNEDAAWQRLTDLQREMENSRLLADGLSRGWRRPGLWFAGLLAAAAGRVARRWNGSELAPREAVWVDAQSENDAA